MVEARTLGRTGVAVEGVSLGGEGILRTHGREREAVVMIHEALRDGVRYCDTAPAYDDSQEYYGAAFRSMQGARDGVFLASKTHERRKIPALALLEGSLRALGTDHVDLWQMHDLRSKADVDAIFAPNGAIEAAEAAKKAGKIRFVGLTGHHDPDVLTYAMERYAFDSVLLPINPADPARHAVHHHGDPARAQARHGRRGHEGDGRGASARRRSRDRRGVHPLCDGARRHAHHRLQLGHGGPREPPRRTHGDADDRRRAARARVAHREEGEPLRYFKA